jgi:hypothetical protein
MAWRLSGLDALFQPDIVTPAQFYGPRRETSAMAGVRHLMFAVLEDAVRAYQSDAAATNRNRQVNFREAESWLMDAHGDGIFSCDNVCTTLGIDAAFLRRGLIEWRRQHLTGGAPVRLSRRSPVLPDSRIRPKRRRRRHRGSN